MKKLFKNIAKLRAHLDMKKLVSSLCIVLLLDLLISPRNLACAIKVEINNKDSHEFTLAALKKITLSKRGSELEVEEELADDKDTSHDEDLATTKIFVNKQKIHRLFRNSSNILAGLNLKCSKYKYTMDSSESNQQIYAVFEFYDPNTKSSGFLEQSYFINERELSIKIENLRFPSGFGFGKKILDANLEALRHANEELEKKVKLDANTGRNGFVGAYTWAKLGVQFSSSQSNDLQDQFLKYLQYMFPCEDRLNILVWLLKQNLKEPKDFVDIKEYQQVHSYKSFSHFIRCFNLNSFRVKRFHTKNNYHLGKSFLLDPVIAASWEGEITVS